MGCPTMKPTLFDLGHFSRGDSDGVPGRLGVAEEVAEVGCNLVPARVVEEHIRVPLCNVQGKIHVAEAGGEYQLRALLDHVLHDPLRFGGLRHVLRLDELQAGDVLLHLLQAVLHRAVVSEVVDASDVDRAHDQRRLVLRDCGSNRNARRQQNGNRDALQCLHSYASFAKSFARQRRVSFFFMISRSLRTIKGSAQAGRRR